MTEQDKNTEATPVAEAEQETAPLPEEGQGGTECKSELELARNEARENFDKMLRLAAEFENYKKRVEKERGVALKYAEENILKELLPSIDNLERAVEQGRDTGEAGVLLEGVELTLKGLLDALGKFGLQPVSVVGAPFDPNYHEALAMEANEEVPANRIVREFQKGYLFKDRLLRAAKVVVSRGNG